jgi:hypothetical protein
LAARFETSPEIFEAISCVLNTTDVSTIVSAWERKFFMREVVTCARELRRNDGPLHWGPEGRVA